MREQEDAAIYIYIYIFFWKVRLKWIPVRWYSLVVDGWPRSPAPTHFSNKKIEKVKKKEKGVDSC